MTRYHLEPAANATLDEIYAYTFDRWGEAQAERYLTGLFHTFEAIADGAVQVRDAQPLFGIDAQFCRYEHHYIYWKTVGDGRIGIMAIVHENRQQAARFADADWQNGDYR